MNTITLDGKAIKRVAKRLKLLRNVAGGMLGGRTLAALHYESGLVIGMHADEDGDANDVRFVPVIREGVTASARRRCRSSYAQDEDERKQEHQPAAHYYTY